MEDEIRKIIKQARSENVSPVSALVDWLVEKDTPLDQARRLAREWMVKYG